MECSLPDERYYLTSDNIADYYTWIEVDGKPLQVYGVEEKENKIIGYIEAKHGNHFAIILADLRASPPDDAYCTRTFVDGEKCGGKLTTATDPLFTHPVTASTRFSRISGKNVSQTTMQPFLFSKLELTDDDDAACTDENALKSLGSISLKYTRVNNLRASVNPAQYSSALTKKFHEKAKKAQLSHQAGFGKAVTKGVASRTSFTYIDDREQPLQTFEFRYRSRQLLQLEGFIEDSPTPSPRASTSSPTPPIATSASPAQAPASPIASTSNARPAEGSDKASLGAEANERQRIARLEAELESLRRQERIATLERELLALRSGSSTTASGSSSSRKIKADPDARTDNKRVKREAGEASPASQASSSGKGKGKAKEKPAVIELSDSE